LAGVLTEGWLNGVIARIYGEVDGGKEALNILDASCQ
jgi:hypothetical protein